MKYAPQYLQSATVIINQYTGTIPLAAYLKNYFAQNKKFGSKDRKWISHLCYTYYRLGHALKELPVAERLTIALFLCNDQPGDWGALFDDHWLSIWSNDILQRIDIVTSFHPSFSATDVFPWGNELSEGIEWENFCSSHFIQPDLFLRIRPEREKTTIQKLTVAQIAFIKAGERCLALPNASKIDEILEIDRDVVIQDKSSQRIAEFLKLTTNDLLLTTMPVWDCCAASGGKSILAKDILRNIDLTVSDVRPSIIQNLKKRFERVGIKNYHAFISDLANHRPSNLHFRLIICDAPCTGSGTWGRTPEQLYFFSQKKIEDYASLQKKIVLNAIGSLQKNGYFLYITCSVFKSENEAMTAMIVKETSLQLVKAEVLKGYGDKADSMYAALFVS